MGTGRAAGNVHACTGCNLCVKECDFLQRSGNPRQLADGLRECDPFHCTLCGLCTAVCPVGIDPAAFFLERRREVRQTRGGDDPRHAPLIAYERKGTSPAFTFYGLPEQCDTVLFPGCALPGSRPGVVWGVYEELKRTVPQLGIVLDCCLKPSHSLGRTGHFQASFGEIKDYLLERGIRKVLVACPNCQRIFSEYGGNLTVETVYEAFAAQPATSHCSRAASVVVHDPCVSRRMEPVQDAVRELASRQGLQVEEMRHAGRKTQCCGRGGGVNFVRPDTLAQAAASRAEEAAGRPIVTYCAACAESYRSKAATIHLLDLWLKPEEALAGKIKVSRAPFTYLNRLALKRKFRRSGKFAIMRERGGKELTSDTTGRLKAATILLLVATAAALFRLAGGSHLCDPAALELMLQGHEILGPVLFILLYGITPVLFLPGLPMAIAAGLLFGPVWGVVYAITGATLGASASFLVARYLARDWVEAKLTGEMWKNLDQKVGEQGWKIVAVTRLVPLFPFNLLNYAFGLTRIPFWHYVAASFLFMLPACIAFIVFSSSLPALLKGKASPSLVIGTVLISAVMLLPSWYRKKAAS
ncbi:VTT domain-containing protein [Geomonas sp. Red32]|uniref:VTT domain-containing protein n=1 Tax=Geomonas sp. Red32 TaxID=2912856 RepID=UPI00202CC2AD|nr:VTT domain-containing protein [Geomonas sp. Red32]MCM0082198.1 VTT domain-containing protein [Geomonas sp. Red32]